MRTYRYRILNVFAVARNMFSGNPLCVIEDARGLDDATMQALALQFNLSETTFIFPDEGASARMRIFTPAFELPFAGHPTLGTAHVVRALRDGGDTVTLETHAGTIPVTAKGSAWTLQAGSPRRRPAEASREQLAEMLALEPADIGAPPLWVDTGLEQLLVPLKSAGAVARCQPVARLLMRHAKLGDRRYMAYVWAPTHQEEIVARFFFPKAGGIAEDPATGSACANLGGWFLATGTSAPLARRIRQGEAVGRPSLLALDVDSEQRIRVSGEVIELGWGTIHL